ncbi:hypothetical protein WT00_03820 [Burkholderia territorii]|nr:hypothetical protein WT00_03820 [Burkholderia territorii]
MKVFDFFISIHVIPARNASIAASRSVACVRQCAKVRSHKPSGDWSATWIRQRKPPDSAATVSIATDQSAS